MQSVDLVSINSLFSEQQHFTIPRYQRPYSWTKHHIESLFSDFNKLDSGEKHIMGMLVLCKHPGSENRYDIIDGQQRMTTILMVLAWIRDKIFDLSEHPESGLNGPHNEVIRRAYNLDALVWDEGQLRFSTNNESRYEASLLEIALSRLDIISRSSLKKESREAYQRTYNQQASDSKNMASVKRAIFKDRKTSTKLA